MENRGWEGDFPISRYLTAMAAKKKIPLHGIFELTSRCNFDCKMCYIHELTDMEALREKELSVGQWLGIADEARKAGLLFLLLTGGEAMLREDFAELYEGLARMGFRLVINTNGSIVTEQVLDLFRRYPPGRINVSMYGASEETYERLCGRLMHGKVEKAVRELKKIGLSVRTTMSVTPYNCRDMQSVWEFSSREGTLLEMTSYMFPPIRKEDGHCGENLARFPAREAGRYMVEKERISMTPEQFHKRAEHVRNCCGEKEEELSGKEIPPIGTGITCQAGKSSFWITWDGKMRLCGLMNTPEVDVKELGFAEAWRRIHTLADEIRLPAECSVCPRKDLCRACAAMCQAETGRFDRKPEHVCEMSAAMLDVYRMEAGRGIKEQ